MQHRLPNAGHSREWHPYRNQDQRSAGLLLGLLAAPGATASEAQRLPEVSGQTEAEIRERIRASRLTPDQIREALRQAGYSTDMLEAITLGGIPSLGVDTSSAGQPESGALNTEPMPPAAVPNAPRERSAAEMRSEFEKEIGDRVGGADEVRPFGYEIFSYSPTTFEPLAAGPVDGLIPHPW